MKHKILVVDDEAAVQNVCARALDSEPYQLLSAANGKDALDIASMENPDVIVLDINMPLKNGLEVLKELRGDVRTRMIPVILLTAYGAVSDKVDGLSLGADDYVTKPFAVAELKARIASALHRNKLALSANPLTRLPGSPLIEQEVNRRIRENAPFAFLYVDINHFKSYNDAYGFARGDQVIRSTAGILMDTLQEEGGRDWFAGHIGGDDFVIITDSARAPYVAQGTASRFDQRVGSFYKTSDSFRGHVEAKNRHGQWECFPLISLSIGIATSDHRHLNHYAKVVEIASEMKAYCKALPGRRLSRFAFDRRREA